MKIIKINGQGYVLVLRAINTSTLSKTPLNTLCEMPNLFKVKRGGRINTEVVLKPNKGRENLGSVSDPYKTFGLWVEEMTTRCGIIY
jgi:hypothetical protein